jgi:hypothetical protein
MVLLSPTTLSTDCMSPRAVIKYDKREDIDIG